MGANRIKNNPGAAFYLELDRIGDSIRSSLVFQTIDGQTRSFLSERRPDWLLIEEGLAQIASPDCCAGRELLSIGIELCRCAFSEDAIAEILPHLRNHSLRIGIRANPELRKLPWESCRLDHEFGDAGGFLALHPGVQIYRSIDAPGAVFHTRDRIRVLVVWANPSTERFPHLPGIEIEVAGVVSALEAPECGSIECKEIGYATPSSFERSLGQWKPDILHFVGHGERQASGCVLGLEAGERGSDALLYGDVLARWVSESGVKLAVLSGCWTGASSCGLGGSLIEAGLQAVVAMQGPIHDGAAGHFSRAFYASLGAGLTVESAVQQGRLAISGFGNDWVIPVLFQGAEPIDFGVASVVDEPREPHNIPVDDRPFIGRASDISAISERLLVKRQRLITVTGMGGMGKTRLAKKVALGGLKDYPDGVWMVECDRLENSLDLIAAIGEAVGAPIAGMDSDDAEAALASLLGPKRILLYLDCFEHLIRSADTVDRLVKKAPNIQVLVTSRIVLGLEQEFEYRLSPMKLGKKATQQCDSMELFAEAAGHSVNEFSIDAKNRAHVFELCSELEGVPLALVLAAGRLKHIGLGDLLEQVRTRPLEVLKRKGGPKDRHANIQRVVADSWRLLGDDERSLLEKLSLFVGSFSSQDAAEVCGMSRVDLLDGLSVLRDHSIVQLQIHFDSTRYKLLDTVREYISQLPLGGPRADERESCAFRHCERYCRIADEIGHFMKEGRWTEGTSLLWADTGNLRAAARYAVDGKLHGLVRRLFTGLGRLYFESCMFADFERLARAGYAAADALDDPGLASRICGLDGALAACQKNMPKCFEVWQRRIELCESIGDVEGCADALTDLSWEAVLLGQIETGQRYLAQALEIGEKVNNQGLIATCLAQRAQISMRLGDVDKARFWSEEAEKAVVISRERHLTPFVYQSLSALHEQLGDVRKARRSALELMKLSLEGHRYRALSWSLTFLANLNDDAGQIEAAAMCFLAASKLNREIATRDADKVRVALGQFTKRHADLMDDLVAQHKRTSWRSLVASITN
ncbi:MAG: CHAT domain-containing protein [Fimbriimonas sp.]|nr:CHAT domain-containing protein [Fimbriimonas sp.]